jgi:hypothetical protein
MKSTRLTLVVIPALLLAAIVAPFVLFWGDLPNPMAVHWNLSGTPDGSMPPLALAALLAVLFAAIWWAIGVAVSREPGEGPSFIAGLFFFGALMAAVQWTAVLANRDIAEWRAADEFGWFQIALVVGAGLLAGAIGWFLAGGRVVAETHAQEEPITMDVDSDGMLWSGSARGWVTTVAAAAVIIAGVIQWNWITVGLVVVGVVVLVFAEVRLTIGPSKAVISLGWLGVPWRTIPINTITRADVEDVSPLSYGGWGYRGRPGVRAFVIRKGEGIRLTRTGKPDLVVTVDDAARGTALINSMRRVA